jgi:hypothetical protein
MRAFDRGGQNVSGRRGRSRAGGVAPAAWAILFFLVMAPLCRLGAHPISLTSALVNAKEEEIVVDLSMMVEDLVLFYWMETDENFRFPAELLRMRAEKHQEFLLQYFHLRDREGNRLEGRSVDLDFSDVGDEGVHIDDLMAYSIRYRFEFPIEDRPEFLTVSQNFGGDDPAVPSEMLLRVFHHGVHMDSAMLPHGAAHTVQLDWEAGWEHARDDLDAARERLRKRQEDALGITSYSAVYSYLYVTETEVRHEILIPLLTLDTWLPLQRERPEVMTVEEQRAVREEVQAFLARQNRWEIDGAGVVPRLERLDFFGPEYRDFARRAPEQQVSVYNARVGVVLSFPVEEEPRRLRMTWEYFNDRLLFLKSALYAFDERRQDVLFLPHRTGFEWENPRPAGKVELVSVPASPLPRRMTLPVLSLVAGLGAVMAGGAGLASGSRRRRLAWSGVCGSLVLGAVLARPVLHADVPHPLGGAPRLEDEAALELFQALHANIYQAFAHRQEEQIYDALAQSVGGELLEDLYLQIRRSLQVEEEGGAVSRVEEVEWLEGSREAPPAGSRRSAFAYHSTWTVTGTVEHWGHVHTRKNQYEARFTVEGLPEGWRITGFDPLREERLQMQIRVRN